MQRSKSATVPIPIAAGVPSSHPHTHHADGSATTLPPNTAAAGPHGRRGRVSHSAGRSSSLSSSLRPTLVAALVVFLIIVILLTAGGMGLIGLDALAGSAARREQQQRRSSTRLRLAGVDNDDGTDSNPAYRRRDVAAAARAQKDSVDALLADIGNAPTRRSVDRHNNNPPATVGVGKAEQRKQVDEANPILDSDKNNNVHNDAKKEGHYNDDNKAAVAVKEQ